MCDFRSLPYPFLPEYVSDFCIKFNELLIHFIDRILINVVKLQCNTCPVFILSGLIKRTKSLTGTRPGNEPLWTTQPCAF